MRPSLFAAQERGAKRNKLGDTLQVLDRHVDFGALAAEVDRAAPRPDRWHGGRPPFPTEIMVASCCSSNCSTCPMNRWEFQLLDWMSFLRFTLLVNTSQIPDRTTI
jgi:hypothetical protein